MTADFLLLPPEQTGNPDIVRHALLQGKVVVVTRPDRRIVGAIDERSGLESPDGRPAPATGRHVVVDADAPLNAGLRALDEAGARFALVVGSAAGGSQEVLGVIAERDLARLAYATARMTD
jgi:hypothetical protein